jgi:hypothetical protein
MALSQKDNGLRRAKRGAYARIELEKMQECAGLISSAVTARLNLHIFQPGASRRCDLCGISQNWSDGRCWHHVRGSAMAPVEPQGAVPDRISKWVRDRQNCDA